MPRFPVIPQRTSAPVAFSNTPHAQAADFGAGIGRHLAEFGSGAAKLGQEIELRRDRQLKQVLSRFDLEIAQQRVESDAQAPPEEDSDVRFQRYQSMFETGAETVLKSYGGQGLYGGLREGIEARREVLKQKLLGTEAQRRLQKTLGDARGLIRQWSERVAADPSEFSTASLELLGDAPSGEAGVLAALPVRPEALQSWRSYALAQLLDARMSSDPAGLITDLEAGRWQELLPKARRNRLLEDTQEALARQRSANEIERTQGRAGKTLELSQEIGAGKAGQAEIRRAEAAGALAASQAEALRAEAARAEIALQAQQMASDELALSLGSGVGFDLENPQNRQAADAFYETTYSQAIREGAPEATLAQVVSAVTRTGYLPPRLARDTTGLLLGSDETGQVQGAELYGRLREATPDLVAAAIDPEVRARGGVLNRWLEMGVPPSEALRRAEAELPRDSAIHALNAEDTILFQRDLRKRLGNVAAGRILGGLLEGFDKRYQEFLGDGLSAKQAGLLIQRDIGRAFVRLDQLDAQLASAGFIWIERDGERVLVPTEARLQKTAVPIAVAGGAALLFAAAAALSYSIQVSQGFGFDASDELRDLSDLLNSASLETKILMFDAMPFMGEWFDQAAVELDDGEKILAEVVGYNDQVKERYLEGRGPDGTYLVTQAFDWVAGGYVTRRIRLKDEPPADRHLSASNRDDGTGAESGAEGSGDDSKASTETTPKEKKSGKSAQDSGKSEPHGDGGRELEKIKPKIEALEQQLKSAKTKREKVKLRNKIEKIEKNARKKRKGITHGKRGQ